MNLTILILLSGVFGLFNCSGSNVNASATVDTPAQVVREYFALATQGKYDNLESLTVSRTVGPDKKVANAAAENTAQGTKGDEGISVAPDRKASAEAPLAWVRNDFPKSVHDDGLAIEAIKSENAKGDEARVVVTVRNKTAVSTLGWVFLLHKEGDKWKIYDITTEGDERKNME